MKDCILITSRSRPQHAEKCIQAVRSFPSDVPIFLVIEREQQEMYSNILGMLSAWDPIRVVILPKSLQGLGYARWYSYKFLHREGFDYIMNIDDDLSIKYDPELAFEDMRRNDCYWMGCWFSHMDFYIEPEIEKYNSRIFPTRTSFYARAFILDSQITEDLGGWDPNLNVTTDEDLGLRMIVETGVFPLVNQDWKTGCRVTQKSKGEGGIADLPNYEKRLQDSYEYLLDKWSHEEGKWLFKLTNTFRGKQGIKINRRVFNNEREKITWKGRKQL